MKKALLLVLVSLVAHLIPVCGQHLTRSNISIGTGLVNRKVVDQTVSPMIYRGLTAPMLLDMSFNGRSGTNHRISLHFDHMNMKSRISNTDNNNLHLLNSYSFGLEYFISKVVSSSPGTEHNVGLGLGLQANYRDLTTVQWMSGPPVADGIIPLSLSYGFGTTNFPVFFDYFRINLSLPFVSLVYFEGMYNGDYSYYFHDMDYDNNLVGQLLKKGKVLSFGKFFQVNSKMEFVKKISPHFSAKFGHSFSFYRFNKFERLLKVKSLNSSFLLGISYNFGKNEK